MRWLLILPALLAALLVAYGFGVFDTSNPESDLPLVDVDGTVGGLEGRSEETDAVVDPYAEISDWRELVKKLQGTRKVDPRWNERVAALAEADASIVDELIEALRERHDRERETTGLHVVWVQQALAALGRVAIPKMVVALEDPEAALRERIIGVLLVLGADAAPAVPIAMRTAKNESADVYERGWMISLLGTIGPESKAILPYLHAMLRHGDAAEYLEETGVVALFRIDGGSEEVLETYSILLRGEWFEVRRSILQIVVDDLKGVAAPLVLDVLAILDDESNDRMHPLAVRALQAIGKDDPGVVAKLGDWVEDPPYRDARESACIALAKLGLAGQEKLVQVADFDDEDLLSAAVLALSDNGAPDTLVLPLVERLLASPNAWRRSHGLIALARTPTDAASAWPLIERHIESELGEERGSARAAIFALRDPPKDALAELDVALAAEPAEEDEEQQTATLSMVDLRAVTDDRLLDRFFRSAQSERQNVHYGIAWALRTMPPELEERALPVLIALAGDDNVGVAHVALESLGHLGDRAASAADALRRIKKEAARDPDRRYLVWTLERTLQRIGAE